jgi:elongation factor G
MRAFAVIGPSHSGKSTLVSGLATLEGGRPQSLQLLGGAAISTFSFMGDAWAALDIPGGKDEFALVGPAVAACDAAILCVPAEADAAVLSAPYLRLIEDSDIPTFLFINRIDVATDRISEIVAGLQVYCPHTIVLRQIPMRSGEDVIGAIDLISERAWEYHDGDRSSLIELPADMRPREIEARADLLESLADFDDDLLEQIIEDQAPANDDVYSVATRALQHHDLLPAFMGSASHGNGLLRLMKSLRHEAPATESLRSRLELGADVIAVSCLADNRKHLGKTTLIRALEGTLTPGSKLNGSAPGALTRIDAKTPVTQLAPGEFALAIKSDHVSPGQFLSATGAHDLPDWTRAHAPTIQRLVKPLHDKDENKLSMALAGLADIDPGLTVAQDPVTGHSEIGVQGTQHLRATIAKLADAHGVEIECEDVPAAMCETIRRGLTKQYRHRKQSGGAGQFADVVIEIAPLASGSGFAFSQSVKGGTVPKNYIPAVETGVREALAAGPAGFPVVDVGVTLTDGKAHSVDSSDYAFRTAGQNAVREALAEAGTMVLQPILKIQIDVPSIFAGELVQLVSTLKGRVLGFEAHPTAAGWDVFRALLPMAVCEDLAQALGGTTRGTAWFTTELDHYEEFREPMAASG